MKSKYLCPLIFVCLPCFSQASTLKFTYTSNSDGVLGYFTVAESDFYSHVNSPHSGYLSNQYISDFSFSFRGYTWDQSDIDRTGETIFASTSGLSLPTVQGGNGALSSTSDHFWSIVLFGGGTAFFADTQVQGSWNTTLEAVPIPASAWLFTSALAIPLMRRRTNNS